MAAPAIAFNVYVMPAEQPARRPGSSLSVSSLSVSSLLAGTPPSTAPLCRFRAHYTPEQSFAEVWTDIQRRYDSYDLDDKDQAYFSRLQDYEGIDIHHADRVGTYFSEATPKDERKLYMQQKSRPPKRRNPDDSTEDDEDLVKRRRLEAANGQPSTATSSRSALTAGGGSGAALATESGRRRPMQPASEQNPESHRPQATNQRLSGSPFARSALGNRNSLGRNAAAEAEPRRRVQPASEQNTQSHHPPAIDQRAGPSGSTSACGALGNGNSLRRNAAAEAEPRRHVQPAIEQNLESHQMQATSAHPHETTPANDASGTANSSQGSVPAENATTLQSQSTNELPQRTPAVPDAFAVMNSSAPQSNIAGKSWTPTEDKQLLSGIDAGFNCTQIVKNNKMNRTEAAARNRKKLLLAQRQKTAQPVENQAQPLPTPLDSGSQQVLVPNTQAITQSSAEAGPSSSRPLISNPRRSPTVLVVRDSQAARLNPSQDSDPGSGDTDDVDERANADQDETIDATPNEVEEEEEGETDLEMIQQQIDNDLYEATSSMQMNNMSSRRVESGRLPRAEGYLASRLQRRSNAQEANAQQPDAPEPAADEQDANEQDADEAAANDADVPELDTDEPVANEADVLESDVEELGAPMPDAQEPNAQEQASARASAESTPEVEFHTPQQHRVISVHSSPQHHGPAPLSATRPSTSQRNQFVLHLQSGHMDDLSDILHWDRTLVGADGMVEVGRPGFITRLHPNSPLLKNDNEYYAEAKKEAKPRYVKDMQRLLKIDNLNFICQSTKDSKSKHRTNLLRARLRRQLREKMGMPLAVWRRPRYLVAGVPEPVIDPDPPRDDESLFQEILDVGVDADLEIEIELMRKGQPDTMEEFLAKVRKEVQKAMDSSSEVEEDEQGDEDAPEFMDRSREVIEVDDSGPEAGLDSDSDTDTSSSDVE